jgi:hypothetical protein
MYFRKQRKYNLHNFSSEGSNVFCHSKNVSVPRDLGLTLSGPTPNLLVSNSLVRPAMLNTLISILYFLHSNTDYTHVIYVFFERMKFRAGSKSIS